MKWLPLFLVACRGCTPEIPSNNKPDPQDSSKPDSKESQPNESQPQDSPVDTAPPLFCNITEIEPNDTLSQPMILPMYDWVCGHVDHIGDADFYNLTTTEPGWVTIEVEAASHGSSADMALALSDGDRAVVVYDGYLSTDPRIVFPADTPASFDGWLSETNPLVGGDEYTWYMRASISKPAIGWSREEVEPNGPTSADAEPFTIEERVFGTLSDSDDTDWYHLVTPEGANAIIIDVEAFKLGSPLDSTVVVRDAEGKIVKWIASGEIDYDLDPHSEIKVEGVQDWTIEIFNPSQQGSRFHWYTLTIQAEYP